MNQGGHKMTSSPLIRLTVLIIVAFSMTFAGCATTRQSNFYTLQPIPGAGKPETGRPAQRFISLGIGPIHFPDYLNRPQIVTRIGRNELQIAEYDRWAGDLHDNFKNILADNLSILLNADRVSTFPWQDSANVNYQITMDILQLDGALGGEAVLTARWTIYGKDGKTALISKKSTFRAPVKGSGYEELVSAENQALTDLSREIAAQIRRLATKYPTG